MYCSSYATPPLASANANDADGDGGGVYSPSDSAVRSRIARRAEVGVAVESANGRM